MNIEVGSVSEWRTNLHLFLQVGLSLNEPLYGNDHTLLHEVLEHTFCCLCFEHAEEMFAAAAECGATLSLNGQAKNDLYSFARKQLKQAKPSKLRRFFGSNEHEGAFTWKRILFLEAVVKVLKQYSANGGRWPDDLRAVLGVEVRGFLFSAEKDQSLQ